MEHTDLLAEGLREEDRVGTGIERPLELTSASLLERGTVLAENSHINSEGSTASHSKLHHLKYFIDAECYWF